MDPLRQQNFNQLLQAVTRMELRVDYEKLCYAF